MANRVNMAVGKAIAGYAELGWSQRRIARVGDQSGDSGAVRGTGGTMTSPCRSSVQPVSHRPAAAALLLAGDGARRSRPHRRHGQVRFSGRAL